MAKYSDKADIKDEFIIKFSKDSDHQEAEEYVNKVLSKMGFDGNKVTVMSPMLKELSICYATYKRAFYEFKTRDDIFYQKYISHEKELKELTTLIIKGTTRVHDRRVNTRRKDDN